MPAAVTRIEPTGSPAMQSNPQETSTRSGRYNRPTGTNSSSITRAYSASPCPLMSGTLTVYPRPLPSPVSIRAPLPG